MEELKTVCKNPWCKGTFFYKEEEMTVVGDEKFPPKHCKKCQSFEKDLSGGIEWKDKEYEGDRFDGMPHQIRYKVTNYK